MKRILEYLNQFRLQWGVNCLFFGKPPRSSKKNVSDENEEAISSFSVQSVLRPNWYMLEIQVKADIIRVNGKAYLNGNSEHSYAESLDLTLLAGRMFKRLIRVAHSGRLCLELQLPSSCWELQHFRLVRVTRAFAVSRMLTKLQATHPSYKIRAEKMPCRALKDSAKTSDISKLWKDYCALFDKSAEIVPYSVWIGAFDCVTDDTRAAMRARIAEFERRPLVSIVMRVSDPHPIWLQEAIASIRNQVYGEWELCVADDASGNPVIRRMLARYARLDKRIKVLTYEQTECGPAASSGVLALAQGYWIALMEQDDLLAEHALFWAVEAINRLPRCRAIYSDEDKIDDQGVRSDPYFKCEWNPDLFYSQNLFSHLGLFEAKLVREVGGFGSGPDSWSGYDLALRSVERIEPNEIHHIARVLYHRRIHADGAAYSFQKKLASKIDGVRALNNHLGRRRVNATAEMLEYGYRVRYSLPVVLPMISLIIPTRNGVKLLRGCVESILAKTRYRYYEILIIDNGSDDPETLIYLKGLASESKIRVIRDDRAFNYSALNNSAVKLARGDIIGLINNDVEVISPDWLCEMVSHASRPEVGAVGARLWYSDDTIQHAGVVLGVDGLAGHVHRFLPRGNLGYYARASLIQSFSAVTGACLLVRKSIYDALGGLNETDLQVACNDVDFCLRLREAGYRNIWTPYAELYHHESASRGFDDTPEKLSRSAREVAYMKHRWGDALLQDPAYSPNLSLDGENFDLAWPPRVESFVSATGFSVA
ncbi:GT2 family glycosyltransferase [Paraburkholderia sp. UCT70]|uniref:glycosyltransferase family 2 protein n=1 Tax=Paraburkholderia sp. UCT70 TaxID=2991068 RepID=UPI003D1B5A91